MTVIYDNSFNMNEWFVILNILLMSLLLWILPKKFSVLENVAFYLFGVAYGIFYDHTISYELWDLYDVNDQSSYKVIDFLSYVMYGPYSFLFIYLYVGLNIQGFMHMYYVLVWSLFSLVIEWVGLKVGLYHFNKGYSMYWSFPIYFLAQSMLLIFYQVIKRSSKKM
jgi:hypothetical protein